MTRGGRIEGKKSPVSVHLCGSSPTSGSRGLPVDCQSPFPGAVGVTPALGRVEAGRVQFGMPGGGHSVWQGWGLCLAQLGTPTGNPATSGVLCPSLGLASCVGGRERGYVDGKKSCVRFGC